MKLILETERLILRQIDWQDFDALHRIWGDRETMIHYPAAYSPDQTRAFIAMNIARYQHDGFGLWALIHRRDDQLVGDCGITMQPVEDEVLPEVGYHLHRYYWGQGLATEAACACLEHAHGKLEFEQVVAIIRDVNTPSRRVAERLGMALWKEIDRAGMPHLVYESVRSL